MAFSRRRGDPLVKSPGGAALSRGNRPTKPSDNLDRRTDQFGARLGHSAAPSAAKGPIQGALPRSPVP